MCKILFCSPVFLSLWESGLCAMETSLHGLITCSDNKKLQKCWILWAPFFFTGARIWNVKYALFSPCVAQVWSPLASPSCQAALESDEVSPHSFLARLNTHSHDFKRFLPSFTSISSVLSPPLCVPGVSHPKHLKNKLFAVSWSHSQLK